MLVDTQGLIITAVVHSAAIQDYDGAKLVFDKAAEGGRTNSLKLIRAEGGCALDRVAWARGWKVEIIKRSDNAHGFKLLPRWWVVERTFSRMAHNRRLVRDYERLTHTIETFIYPAMYRLLLKRLIPKPKPPHEASSRRKANI